jgi:hypothetical protein
LRFHFTLTITPEACGTSGLLASHSEVSDTLIEKSPVVFTCDISVLQVSFAKMSCGRNPFAISSIPKPRNEASGLGIRM